MSDFTAKIIDLKCTKFDFGWGSDPDPAGGAYSAPSDLPLAGFKGAYCSANLFTVDSRRVVPAR